MREDYELRVHENYLLKGHIWKGEDAKAIVVLCHGMAEHIERYDELATLLSNNGYVVFGYDQRGHGKTAGSVDKLGYMDDKDNFKAMLSDLDINIEYAKGKYPGLKVFLIGHSMGSFISQRYIEVNGNKLAGCVLSGSSLNKGLLFSAGYIVSSLVLLFNGRRKPSKLMNKLSFGMYNDAFKPNRTEYDWLSRNEENVDRYIADEYCGTVFSSSFFKDMLHMFILTNRNYRRVRCDLPISIMSGEMDPVSNASVGAKKLKDMYNKIGNKNVDLHIYPTLRHEIFMEKERDEVFKDLLEFLNNN